MRILAQIDSYIISLFKRAVSASGKSPAAWARLVALLVFTASMVHTLQHFDSSPASSWFKIGVDVFALGSFFGITFSDHFFHRGLGGYAPLRFWCVILTAFTVAVFADVSAWLSIGLLLPYVYLAASGQPRKSEEVDALAPLGGAG